MKRLLVIGLALVLAACAAINAVTPGSAVTPTASAQLTLSKGELVIDTTYNGVETAYLTFGSSLPAATKANVKALLLSILSCSGTPPACTGYLDAAHKAAAIGDQTTLNAQVAQITAIIGEIKQEAPSLVK